MGFSSFFLVFIGCYIGCDGFLFEKNVLRRQTFLNVNKKFPFSNQYFENYIRRLNSKNISVQHESILGELTKNKEKNKKKNYQPKTTIQKSKNPNFDFEIIQG